MSLLRSRIAALAAVAVLTGLPVGGTLCAALCVPAAAAASSEARPHACHESAPAPLRMAAAPDGDCGSHDGWLTEGADAVVTPRAAAHAAAVPATASLPPAPELPPAAAALPPGPIPPHAPPGAPLVLRI